MPWSPRGFEVMSESLVLDVICAFGASVSDKRAEIIRLPVDPVPAKLTSIIDSGLQFR